MEKTESGIAERFKETRIVERKELHSINQPQYSNLLSNRRGVLATISTISATIGAFSFLLFDTEGIVCSLTLLIIGDLLLLTTIIVSVFFYIVITQKDLLVLHKSYYDSLEWLNEDIDKAYEVLSGKISLEQLQEWARIRIKDTVYNRPEEPSFSYQWISFMFFSVAMLFIFSSFIFHF